MFFFHAVKHINSLPPNLPVLSRDFYVFHCSWVRRNKLFLFSWEVEKPLQANLKSVWPKEGILAKANIPWGHSGRWKGAFFLSLLIYSHMVMPFAPTELTWPSKEMFRLWHLPHESSWGAAEITDMSKGDLTVCDGWGNSTYPIFY